MKVIIDAILFCAKQCIALQGDDELICTVANPENFLSILKLMSNDTFRKYIETIQMKNATYISSQTQYELLDIMGRLIVLQDTINEIN